MRLDSAGIQYEVEIKSTDAPWRNGNTRFANAILESKQKKGG